MTKTLIMVPAGGGERLGAESLPAADATWDLEYPGARVCGVNLFSSLSLLLVFGNGAVSEYQELCFSDSSVCASCMYVDFQKYRHEGITAHTPCKCECAVL